MTESKYPAHDCLAAYLENIPKDQMETPSIFGWFGCYYGSVYDIFTEFQSLQSENAGLREAAKRGLTLVSKALDGCAFEADEEVEQQCRDYIHAQEYHIKTALNRYNESKGE